MEQLAGRTAFITGGASGIGLGMARAFLAEGMKVAVIDYSEDNLAAARHALDGAGEACFVACDVADRDSLRAAAAEVVARLGAIHVLCNNAGVNGGGKAADPDFAAWDRALAINLGGVINGTKIVVPIIRAQGQGGHVVNTSSMAGMVPMPNLGAYSTSKYAIRGFSESLRLQLARDGIGVTCLFPGATRTAIVPLPEDDPTIDEASAPPFLQDLWEAMRGAIDPLDTGRAVVQAIRENRFYAFTNREFLPEVQQRHREIEAELAAAMPEDEPTAARVRFEARRSEMVRRLMQPGPAPAKGDSKS